jgi:hypothetical protein
VTLERQLLVFAVFDSGLDCDEWLHRNPSFRALGWRSETRRAACPRPVRTGRASPPGHPDVATRNEPRALLLTMRSRRATDGRPDPVRCCHRAAFGPRSGRGLGSAANHVHWRVHCRCSRSDPGRSPRPRVSPPKRRAARPAGDPLVPAGPPTEADGRGRGLGDTNDAHPRSHLRQESGPQHPRGCRRSSPRAAPGRSQQRCRASPSDVPPATPKRSRKRPR